MRLVMDLSKLYTCATIRVGAKDISMDDASKAWSAHDPTNSCWRCGLAHEAFHNKSRNPRHTHCVPICTESSLGSPPVIHHNVSTICDVTVSGEVPDMARLKLKSLRRRT